jgi:hypothetical protein
MTKNSHSEGSITEIWVPVSIAAVFKAEWEDNVMTEI